MVRLPNGPVVTAPPPFHVYLPGERPNENRGPELLATSISLTALALTIVGMRLYVRIRIINSLFTDDYLMVLSALSFVAMTVLVVIQAEKGAGRHIEYIGKADFVAAQHANFATQPICLASIGLARLSVACFLLRFASSRVFKWIIWATMGLSVALTLQGVLHGDELPPRLVPEQRGPLAVIPIPMLWNVQMNWRVKSAVMGILSLGFLTVTAAILKTMFMTKWGLKGDYMWDSTDITIWYNVEISVAIIAGSIPCLKPLFKRMLASTARYGYSGSKGATPAGPGYMRSRGKPSPGAGGRSTPSGSRPESKARAAGRKADPYAAAAAAGRPYHGGRLGVDYKVPMETVSEGRPSDDIIIQKHDDERSLSPCSPYGMQHRIVTTTQITVAVEEQERRVKDMV
ncbi:hypothetical protein GGTG_05612 [Gaeumannomyces tritici R3-111a-1]|uniref:Rhodopsin domain-containing protein n=1 Tax=Gaeumannomyces tritici (strain R3-111a-1) TaxID=644352 RepID=J3NWE8_GAET3|nr:hypothetical protein GGTG_05612 [Gaeumannomyces tritici R3-111a-1]EJT75680.1 hypothetical protein GGTG_05612 [Gaeumannomyces tritici R3-111a-1]